jgi:hypothetical protein
MKPSRSMLAVASLVAAITASSGPALAEALGFAGAGAIGCQQLNSNTIPGRGSGQNTVSQLVFSWVQGYMSGFNSYSYLIKNDAPFDLGAASTEAQWETIVSYCRSHPYDPIVRAIQDMQLKLLKK